MFGVSHNGLLVTAALLALLQTGTQARVQDYKTSATLPNWRTDSDYITSCNFNDDTTPFCDWMSEGLLRVQSGADEYYLAPERSSSVGRLESPVLGVSGEACLEFWYQAPLAPNGSELRVLLNGINGRSEVWAIPALDGEVWRYASIPLTSTDQRQVVFEAKQGLHEEQQVALRQVEVSRGQCGRVCDSDREFWTEESTRCLCSDGQLSCASSSSSSSCPEGQTCGLHSYSPDRARGTCTVDSKPRCSTFDGAIFEVVVPCTYLLAGTCSPKEGLPGFKVEVVNEPRANSSVSPIVQVNVELASLRLTLHSGETGRVMVNGVWKTLPLNLNDKTVKVRGNRAAVVMKTRHGLLVSYHKGGAVRVTVPDSYSGKVCGMCGNFNHLKSDDYRAPAGPENPEHSAEEAASCEATLVPQVCDPLVEAQYASEAHCGGLLSGTGPFAGCHALLEAESFYRSCVAEMCAASGDPAALCGTLESYVAACRDAGVTLPAWRNSTVCPLACGPNSHYNPCAEGCPEACSIQDSLGVCGKCMERCECDPGFKLSGGSCVPAEDCGCWRNGEHYKRGATFMEGECERQCTCTGNNDVRCSNVACGADEVCRVKEGVKECHVAKPVMCRVYGDPHYTTFDGKAYTFQGGCNYTLTTTCSGHTPVQFTVTGRNQNPANGTRSKLEAVALHVSGLHLSLKTSGGDNVLVNGSRVSLPFKTSGPFGSLEVSKDKTYTVVATTFGFRMMTDGRDRLFLQVDERYYGEMCGLCGVYSGHQDDEFLKPDGSHASTASEFGHSWRVEDSEHSSCIAFPDEPRRCELEEEDKAMEECSLMLGDAFQPCLGPVHPQTYLSSCTKDYCATAGDRQVLCSSLESYVAACQVAGVELVDWRNGTACADPPVPPRPEPVCPATHCNFDDNLCGWRQLVQDSFDWTRHSGPTPSDFTGPSRDHTTGAGSYMYTEGDIAEHGDSARLMSPPCQSRGPVCLSFWYHMYGQARAMAINIYLIQGNANKKLWSRVNSVGSEWRQANIDIHVEGPFFIIVEGIRGSTYQSDVAIDDVAVHAGPCSGSPGLIRETSFPFLTVEAEVAPSHPVCNLECTFDDHLCSWSQMITDAFDWTWQSGSTPTLHTGPSGDHSGGDGHYLYIESSSVTHGDTARLLSSECSDSGPQCLQFWYHMYGSAQTMGLNVYLLQGRMADAVWWKRDDQGDAWHLAQVDITASGPFQVIFEGRRGSNENSDVAIDDVILYRGRCSDLGGVVTPRPPRPDWNTTAPPGPVTIPPLPPAVNVTALPPITVDPPMVTDSAPTTNGSIAPVCKMNCDFDHDTCEWNQLVTDAFDWTWQSGSTPTAMTGPSSDHTIGNPDGHYLYIESSSVTHGDTARLLSSECSDSGPQCLQFWYHMYGSAQTMGLHVYLLQGRMADSVWWKRDDQGDAWHLAQVDITASGPFQIIFEGRRGSNEESDVAIDDVSLNAGHCSDLVIPTTTTAPTTTRPTFTTAPDCNTQPGITTNVPETTPTTAEPQPPTTAEPQPPTTAEPQPPTTAEPQPPTTAEPQPPTTAEPQPPTTAEPQPPTTSEPQPPTTSEPQPPTTSEPQPPTTSEPQPPTTSEPQPPTTAEPQPPTTTAETPVPTTVRPTPSCPKNSHYTTCLSACNPSCKHLHGPPNCNVDEACVAGCVCNDGFVLKQRVCVPIQQCGCVDRNGNSHHFNEVWYTKHCSQKCECEEDDGVGEIDCDDDKDCDRDEVCLQNEAGQHYCKSTDFSECSVNGDPEYRTFDDLKHEFKGRESYVLVQTTGLSQNLPEVYIEGINKLVRDEEEDDDKNSKSSEERGVPRDNRGRDDDSDEDDDSREDDSREDDSKEDDDRQRLRGLKIRVYNHTVEFKKNRKVILDGVRTRVPVNPSGGLKIMERSSRIYLKTDFGLSVEFNGDSKAEIILPHTYKRKVGGLCGNFDGRKKNDLMKPDGNQAKGVQEFGQSWRVTQDSLRIKWRQSSSINRYAKA